MENASKALLIAGAILIVILLIAVGMLVYNGARGSIDKAIGQMSSTEKDIHNKQFEPYLNDKVSGSNLKTLYSKVLSNNGEEGNVKVNITILTKAANATKPTAGEVTNVSADLSGSMSNVVTNASQTYKVTATYTNGVITAIQVKVN